MSKYSIFVSCDRGLAHYGLPGCSGVFGPFKSREAAEVIADDIFRKLWPDLGKRTDCDLSGDGIDSLGAFEYCHVFPSVGGRT